MKPNLTKVKRIIAELDLIYRYLFLTLYVNNHAIHTPSVSVSRAPPKRSTPPHITCERRQEPSDELKICCSSSSSSFSPCGLTHPRLGQSRSRVEEMGEEGNGGEEREGQDHQPPGLAAHRSCHSWEGKEGGRKRGGWSGRR